MARCSTCHRRLPAGKACLTHGGSPAPDVPHAAGAVPAWPAPIGECLGTGGFASVWQIPDGVLKVAHAGHELARARMAREAEALAAIGAPAVPQLLGHGVLEDGRAWIAMERITGSDLGALLTSAIRTDAALAIAIALLDALAQVHAAGFVHRDLKPDNVVRRADNSIVILDLGLARKLPSDPDDPTRAGVQVGSIEYMAPEQLLDAAAADARADIYAFGCVLYELCAGRPPFLGDAAALERAHAALRPPPLSALAPVPAAIEAVCHDCLAKLPSRRPASAAEVRDRMLAAAEPPSRAHGRSVSMVSEGKQPVVLLWAELPRVDRALIAALAAHKISLISQRGRRVLGAVIGAEHADPAGTAIAAARELAAAGARVALHLELLRVTPKLVGAGAAIDKPEGWIPAVPWTGVVLTKALAMVTRAPTRPSELPGFARLGDPSATIELFGRDALISDLLADAAAALGGGGPGMAVLIGDHGIGKTALVAALAPRLGELSARIRVHAASVPPPGSGRPGASALAGLIDADALGVRAEPGAEPSTEPANEKGTVIRAVGDALRSAARVQPLAVILDDVHLAEHELLDALEYATLGGEPLALWILVLALPRLDQRRPRFGGRAERHRRDVLGPLDDDAALAMTTALLRPAEYPPLRALRQIATIAHGHPLHLVSLAREIHDRGAIRMRPNGEHFLDTTALDAIPPIALGPWLAARELAGHSVELVALARVCATLGDELDRAEIAEVVERVERRGGATTTIDVDVGLAELTAAGILVPSGQRLAFRQALLQEGVYATTNEAERRVLHQAALERWHARPLGEPGVAERVAYHAEAAGERQIAARAFAALGERAHRAHRPLDADQAWQGALRNLDARDLVRGRALLGRARARYRLQRARESLVDLDEALAIATLHADARLEVEALLEQATALDWCDDYAGSAAITERAVARFAGAPDRGDLKDLEPEVALAHARMLYRHHGFASLASVEAMAPVVELAMQAGHAETETIARLMLAPALAFTMQFEASRRVFDELIALCRREDDRFHLAVAHANRMMLWSASAQLDRVEADLRTVIQLAREGGQVTTERIGTHNLAEHRLWRGAFAEAVALARRGLSLQRGHGEGSTAIDELMLARALVAIDEVGEARALLGSLAMTELANEYGILAELLRCYVDDAEPARWRAWLTRVAAETNEDLRLESALLAHRKQVLPPDQRAELGALAARKPGWAWLAL